MSAVLRLLPGGLDLHLYRGDDARFQITMTEGGSPTVLPTTGWMAQIRGYMKGPVLATFTIDATNAALGVVRLSLDGADTADLPDTARWDLQCDTAGAVRTYLAGTVTAEGQVTQ